MDFRTPTLKLRVPPFRRNRAMLADRCRRPGWILWIDCGALTSQHLEANASACKIMHHIPRCLRLRPSRSSFHTTRCDDQQPNHRVLRRIARNGAPTRALVA